VLPFPSGFPIKILYTFFFSVASYVALPILSPDLNNNNNNINNNNKKKKKKKEKSCQKRLYSGIN
jgi:hypothetical protein